jgi:hypothetical protein
LKNSKINIINKDFCKIITRNKISNWKKELSILDGLGPGSHNIEQARRKEETFSEIT